MTQERDPITIQQLISDVRDLLAGIDDTIITNDLILFFLAENNYNKHFAAKAVANRVAVKSVEQFPERAVPYNILAQDIISDYTRNAVKSPNQTPPTIQFSGDALPQDPTDGQIAVWDATSETWVAQDIGSDLPTDATNGQIAIYNANTEEWEAQDNVSDVNVDGLATVQQLAALQLELTTYKTTHAVPHAHHVPPSLADFLRGLPILNGNVLTFPFGDGRTETLTLPSSGQVIADGVINDISFNDSNNTVTVTTTTGGSLTMDLSALMDDLSDFLNQSEVDARIKAWARAGGPRPFYIDLGTVVGGDTSELNNRIMSINSSGLIEYIIQRGHAVIDHDPLPQEIAFGALTSLIPNGGLLVVAKEFHALELWHRPNNDTNLEFLVRDTQPVIIPDADGNLPNPASVPNLAPAIAGGHVLRAETTPGTDRAVTLANYSRTRFGAGQTEQRFVGGYDQPGDRPPVTSYSTNDFLWLGSASQWERKATGGSTQWSGFNGPTAHRHGDIFNTEEQAKNAARAVGNIVIVGHTVKIVTAITPGTPGIARWVVITTTSSDIIAKVNEHINADDNEAHASLDSRIDALEITGTLFKGTWDTDTIYTRAQQVFHGAQIWELLAETSEGHDPVTNPNLWRSLTDSARYRGGADGTTKNYHAGDIDTYQGGVYFFVGSVSLNGPNISGNSNVVHINAVTGLSIGAYSSTATYSRGSNNSIVTHGTGLWVYVSGQQRNANHDPDDHPQYWLNLVRGMTHITLDQNVSQRYKQGTIIVFSQNDAVYLAAANVTTPRGQDYIVANSGLGQEFIHLNPTAAGVYDWAQEGNTDDVSRDKIPPVREWTLNEDYRKGEIVDTSGSAHLHYIALVENDSKNISNRKQPGTPDGIGTWDRFYTIDNPQEIPFNIIRRTQAQYDGISNKDGNTLYVIIG